MASAGALRWLAGEFRRLRREMDELKGEKEKKTQKLKDVSAHEREQLNKIRPLWRSLPEEVTAEEYASFYKSLSSAPEEHLAVKHFIVKGQPEFRALLFVPRSDESKKRRTKIMIYERRVFVRELEELMPEWLSMVMGVVDSEDLPLNVSQDDLLQNKVVRFIKKNLVNKCLEIFAEIAENEEDYKVFYDQFGKYLKLGIQEDFNNRHDIAKLLRFHSSKSGSERVSLSEYVARMKEDQHSIYYITGESLPEMAASPLMEDPHLKGLEVLYMADPSDEYTVQQMSKFDGKKFTVVGEDGDNEPNMRALRDEFEAKQKELKDYIDASVGNLDDKISGKIDTMLQAMMQMTASHRDNQRSIDKFLTKYEDDTYMSLVIRSFYSNKEIVHGARH